MTPPSSARGRRLRVAVAAGAAVILLGGLIVSRPAVRHFGRDLARRPVSQWRDDVMDRVSRMETDLAVIRLVLLLIVAALAVWAMANAVRLRGVLQRFFQEQASPIDLAVFRIFLFAALFLSVEPARIERYARMPGELLTPPLGFGLIARVIPITPGLADAAVLVLRTACVFAVIGLFSRSSALIAALLSIYVLGIFQSCGRVVHNHYLVWFSLILAFSPCGDALSLDSAWRRWRRGETMPESSVIYARPIRWVWLLMGVIYLFPGLWKLWISGQDWLFGDAMMLHMRAKWHEIGWISPIRLDRIPWLARLAGIGAVGFELSFLPLVLHRRARPWVAVTGLLFHNLTGLILHISFWPLQCAYVSFLPVGRIFQRWTARPHAPPEQPPRSATRALRAVDGLGALLLIANLVMGSMLIIRAWPIACFPTFAWTPKSVSTDLEFVSVSSSNSARTIPLESLLQDYGPERWNPMVGESRDRPGRLAVLARMIASATPEGRNAVRIDVYRVIWSTDPDRRSAGPLSRELLTSVDLSQAAEK